VADAALRSETMAPAEALASGIWPASWCGWANFYSENGVSLFVEGFAATHGEPNPTNPGAENGHGRVIAAYRKRGVDFVKFLRGSFAIALWDSLERRLILAADHLGTRPIYYSASHEPLAFATHVGRLARGPKIVPTINRNSLYFYLNHSCIPAPFTIYDGIRRLEPGQMLVHANGQVTVRRYWDVAYHEQNWSEAEAAVNLATSVEDSVRFALHSESPDISEVGAFLSGGTDSSTVLGLLSKIAGERINSFSVGFEEAAYNEIHYARVAANHFKSKASEHFVRPAEALEAIPDLAAIYDEPFSNSSAIPTFFCLKMAREAGVKIMFAGDGGDELYGGNERYLTEKVFTLYHRIPRALRFAIDGSVELIPGFYPWRKVRNYVRKANQPAVERFFAYQMYFRDRADEYFSDDFIGSIERDFPLEVPRQHYERAGDIAALNRLLYIDLKLAVSDNDLFKVNRMAESQGLQVRYPFLDPHVAEVAGKIPANLKVKGWSKRYIFKKAFGNLLPEEILQKKKHGFGLPTGDWLRHHAGFRELARSLLLESRSVQRGYFLKPALEQLLKLHDEEKSSYYGSQIWTFMMLELWHRHHVDRISSESEKA
jgi:asparagine synthase (glutamine-hydrolysing)